MYVLEGKRDRRKLSSSWSWCWWWVKHRRWIIIHLLSSIQKARFLPESLRCQKYKRQSQVYLLQLSNITFKTITSLYFHCWQYRNKKSGNENQQQPPWNRDTNHSLAWNGLVYELRTCASFYNLWRKNSECQIQNTKYKKILLWIYDINVLAWLASFSMQVESNGKCLHEISVPVPSCINTLSVTNTQQAVFFGNAW